METALTDPRKTEVNGDFSVSTALFRTRFETRIFTETDYLPAVLLKRLEENISDLVSLLVDSHYVETDSAERYNDDTQQYDECVSGYAVETYAFKDAKAVHDVIVATLQGFVRDFTRVVKYI